MTTNDSNLALLIDGDNVSHRIIAGLIAEVANYGTASNWKTPLLEHSITPIQQFAYTSGKNATDSAMIIDAMDLLYTGRFTSFALVSSDSDFTRLASRIREQGLTVYGFGERKTPAAFMNACTKFIFFDVFGGEFQHPIPTAQSSYESDTMTVNEGSHQAVVAPQQLDGSNMFMANGVLQPQVATAQEAKEPNTVAAPVVVRGQQIPRALDDRELNGIMLAVTNAPIYNDTEGDRWVNLATVGHNLKQIGSDLHPANYGYQRLRDFVEASGFVELKLKSMGNHPPVALVRLR